VNLVPDHASAVFRFVCARRPGGQTAGRLARNSEARPPLSLEVQRGSDQLSAPGRGWLPLRHCPGQAEPVKGAFGVGFAANP
jgi:hypothetical protein